MSPVQSLKVVSCASMPDRPAEGLLWGSIGILWGFLGGYIGTMEKKMETTVVYWSDIIFGLYRENGKDNGNDYRV